MPDLTDKQMLKLYREVCKLQGEAITKILADLKHWKDMCQQKGWRKSVV